MSANLANSQAFPPPLTPPSGKFQSLEASKLKTNYIIGNSSNWKNLARVVSTSNITLEGIQTIDSVQVDENDRVLVTAQSGGIANGIYIVSSGTWTRSDDFPLGSHVAGTFVYILDGTLAANTLYVCTNSLTTDTVGVNALVFEAFAGSGGPGIVELNGLTASVQTFATGTTGTDFNISSAVSTHTFNIPNASASARGVVNTTTQTFAGDKTFTGNVTGLTFTATSDVRLKDNIIPIVNAMENLECIQGYVYNLKSGNKRNMGVLAQQLEEAGFDWLVENGENGFKSVNYNGLIPLMIEAIKDLKIQLDDLKEKF